MDKKLIITEKINQILDKKGMTAYKLSQLMHVTDSALYQMIKGETPFSEKFIEKILPCIKVKREEFESWIVADKYTKEVIKLAIEAKKSSKTDCQPIKKILATKLDEILQSKNLSRTALSKQIKHSQSSVNNAITGKESFSKKLMHKISTALDITETEIQSWVIADKYPLEVLEMAVNV